MHIAYNHIISSENLCNAWREFVRDKRYKKDVAEFALNLSENIYRLHLELEDQTYAHGPYLAFAINDPKPRQIHKATVRDRLIHHAIYRVLYLKFEMGSQFIYDSYSCRRGKGTHRALDRLRDFGRKVSKTNRCTCWVLKCDVRKFFASIDQEILLEILKRCISDRKIIWLLENVIRSFHSTAVGKGLPLGNLTSQLLVNIYVNEFDHYVKRHLRVKYYLRYADDFVILHHDQSVLEELLPKIADFLDERLKLTLHPDKIFLKTLASGVDFLGWVHFPDHRVLRTATKRRMFAKLKASKGRENEGAVANSYLGLLGWGNGWKLQKKIHNLYNRPLIR
jgi:retron-type reverse transcriptase